MSAPITTYLHCTDPISLAGVVSQLRLRPEVRVVEELEVDTAWVAVVVAEHLDDDTARVIRGLCRADRPRIVLVATTIDESTLGVAAEAGVAGLLRRTDATADRLVQAIFESPPAREWCLPTCWVGCWSKWGHSSDRCWLHAA